MGIESPPLRLTGAEALTDSPGTLPITQHLRLLRTNSTFAATLELYMCGLAPPQRSKRRRQEVVLGTFVSVL